MTLCLENYPNDNAILISKNNVFNSNDDIDNCSKEYESDDMTIQNSKSNI